MTVPAQKKNSAIDGRTTRHAGYTVSLKKRKLVEEIFGWSKTVGGLRKARFVGLAKVEAQTIFTFAAYNLTRMATIFGWRLSAIYGKSARSGRKGAKSAGNGLKDG